MIKRIIIGIILGGLLGFISGMVMGSALNAPDDSLLNTFYFGMISGLLICLIIEVNKLSINK
ncbi:hypothetical protein [Sporosalibacterium faouarense]|uniref:hypothetical protein n=1 Tax=Sporosalibacterium faouarense TaxID=516123 RepID=UPI00141D0BDE|nr:hypothetical protein [Sporosalibacterium faouarense]MTI47356.1 hypothetical protein [Bacillota bacterium]